MRRRYFSITTACSTLALAATLLVWALSYRGTVGHVWRSESFLLEGKENVDSYFGITATRGLARVEVFATREPASEQHDLSSASRLQTTRIVLPLWCFVIAFGILPLARAFRLRKRRYDPSPD